MSPTVPLLDGDHLSCPPNGSAYGHRGSRLLEPGTDSNEHTLSPVRKPPVRKRLHTTPGTRPHAPFLPCRTEHPLALWGCRPLPVSPLIFGPRIGQGGGLSVRRGPWTAVQGSIPRTAGRRGSPGPPWITGGCSSPANAKARVFSALSRGSNARTLNVWAEILGGGR